MFCVFIMHCADIVAMPNIIEATVSMCDRTSEKVHVVKNRELRKRQNSLLGHKI